MALPTVLMMPAVEMIATIVATIHATMPMTRPSHDVVRLRPLRTRPTMPRTIAASAGSQAT